jgi:hypothetical protein
MNIAQPMQHRNLTASTRGRSNELFGWSGWWIVFGAALGLGVAFSTLWTAILDDLEADLQQHAPVVFDAGSPINAASTKETSK